MASLVRIRSIRRGLLEITVDVRQAQLQEFAERFALERATQNVIAPLLCVVHVAILGRDIEIAEHDELVVGFQFVCKEALQGSQPAELVLIFFRTDATT